MPFERAGGKGSILRDVKKFLSAMRNFKTFKQIHKEKLSGALGKWVKKNGRQGDIFRFIIQKGKNIFLLNYRV